MLIATIRSYFKDLMKAELRRIKLLYACFVCSYFLRFGFQVSLGNQFWKELIPTQATRWYIIAALPLFWDITSILPILVLHHNSFNNVVEKERTLTTTSAPRHSLMSSSVGRNSPKISPRGSLRDLIHRGS